MSVIQKFETMEYGPAPEDPKESLRWLEGHKRRFGHFIAGGWKAPAEGKYFETADPSTGEKIAEVARKYRLHADIERELEWMGPLKDIPPKVG